MHWWRGGRITGYPGILPPPRTRLPVTDRPGIDPDDLATTLRVLRELPRLPSDHDDVTSVKHEASYMYKALKKARRASEDQQRHTADILRRAAAEIEAAGDDDVDI